MKRCVFRSIVIVAITSVYSTFAFASIDTSTAFYMQDVLGRVTPQTAGLINLQTADNNLFSASLSLSIPLYTIDDPDFQIPISLSYTADGFQPRRHTELCGLNWILNAGGCVSRKVQYIPDEYEVNRTYYHDGIFNETVGFLNNPCATDTTHIMMATPRYTSNGYSYDYLPDVFSFSFCGHSGTFIVDNNGQPQIIDGDYVDIDISDLSHRVGTYTPEYGLENGIPACKKIIITTLDGYKYTFGGNTSSMEYTKSLDPFIQAGGIYPTPLPLEAELPPVTTWYLTRITAPNGRVASFSYIYMNNIWQYDEFYVSTDLQDVHNNGTQYNYSASVTRQVVLSGITVDGLHVSFNYNLLNNVLNYSCLHDGYNTYQYLDLLKMFQLGSVRVSTADRMLRDIHLSYEVLHSVSSEKSSYRYLLSSVNVANLGSYEMQYDTSSGNAPALGHPTNNYYSAENIDKQGYARGEMIKWGTLQKIVYPSGGYQLFTYDTAHFYGTEHYYYFQRFTNMHNTLVYRSRTPITNYHSALRLKSISNYDIDDEILSYKSYTYEDGHYYDNCEYTDDQEYHDPRPIGWQYNPATRFGYGQVSEITTFFSDGTVLPQKQKVVYEFYTDNSHTPLSSDLVLGSPLGGNTYALSGLCYSKSELASKLGKLTKKSLYKISGSESVLQKEERLSWSGNNGSNSHAKVKIAVFDQSHAWIARRLYITPVLLTSKYVVDYSGEVPFCNSESYSYDGKNRIVKKEWSDNLHNAPRNFFEKYIYPDMVCPRNSFNTYSDGIQYLVATHQISKPIESLAGYWTIEYNMRSYITFGRLICPVLSHPSGVWTMTNNVYQLGLSEPLLESNFAPLTHPAAYQLMFDERYRLMASYTQNSHLQITSSTPVGELTTYYTWNGNYLESAQIGEQQTSYEVIPHVGVSKITDPRGYSLCYSYDEQGRIIEESQIIQGQKQILKSYNYHYNGQQ